MSSPIELFLYCLPIIFSFVSVLWLLSLIIMDVSIIDIWWGLGFALIALLFMMKLEIISLRYQLSAVLVIIWGVRLGTYLAIRNLGHGEDKRYTAMRANDPYFKWTSYIKVFLLQGSLQLSISLPLYYIAVSQQPFNWIDGVGLGIIACGIIVEAVADLQLKHFLKNQGKEKGVLDTGLWGRSRHPNYFGNAMIWFGLGVVGLSSGASWWSTLGPLVMIFLLMKVSGVALMERTIIDRRPAYADYIRKTPSFFPKLFGKPK